MTQNLKDKFVENLVQGLFKSAMEAEDHDTIPIDRKTFIQVLFYILKEEILDENEAVIEGHLLEVMEDIQQECEKILTLLASKR